MRYINANQTLTYRVEFWNKEDAEVPTQDAVIEDVLDPTVFDLNTFEFTRFGFLKWDVPLAGGQLIDRRVDLQPDMNLAVEVKASFNPSTGQIKWWFHCVDPLTGDYPEDPMDGFLPPYNPETGYEIGWVEFRVKAKDDLPSGTQIANQAFVEFDFAGDLYDHPAPKEGPWINTVDAEAPSSYVLPLPSQTTETAFLVEWTGEDGVIGSGIAHYSIYHSVDGLPFSLWLHTTDTSAIMSGEVGHSYAFYSVATDNVGNIENVPTEPDTVINVISPDSDNDGIPNGEDNCPDAYNPSQENNDLDVWGDVCDLDDDNDGELDSSDCAPLNPRIAPSASEVCNGVDDNCNGIVDDDCNLSSVNDDIKNANTNSNVTITDENNDGVLGEGETFNVEIKTPTSDTCTAANITDAQISSTETPPTIESYNESTLTQREIDAALAKMEELVGYSGEAESINIMSLNSSQLTNYLGTDDYNLLIEIRTALSEDTLEEAILMPNAVILFCGGEYDLEEGICTETFISVNAKCTSDILTDEPTLEDICYKPTNFDPDKVEVRNIPHSTAIISIVLGDGDGDSYPPPLDCNDNDAEVNPGMTEVYNNFRDDDCNPATPDNMNPIADAGDDQTIHAGMSVTLDGSGSYDPERNYPLSYAWEITLKPLSSSAELNDPTSANPSFLADIVGFYIIQLLVTDIYGASSEVDDVLVNTFNSAPTADAGLDQAIIKVGTTIQLDGTQSYDLDGDPIIIYSWTITSKPAGSAATLSNPFAPNPTFVADVHGEYVIELVVRDIFLWPSEPDTVTVGFENIKPVADAGVNQSVVMGDIVYLDGSGSHDANNDPLTFSWSIISKPGGSSAEIINPTLPQTSFIADLPGEYIVSLVVNDGFVDSDPSNVTIVAITFQNAATQKLQELIKVINGLDPAVFKNKNMQNTFTNKINAVLKMIDEGEYQEALNKLENDILAKTDGCAETGSPDKNDWIINCPAQNQVYPLIIEAMGLLGNLL
jgi:hypothetical protein